MHIHVCSLLKYKMHLNLHQYALELNSKCKHSLSPMWMPLPSRDDSDPSTSTSPSLLFLSLVSWLPPQAAATQRRSSWRPQRRSSWRPVARFEAPHVDPSGRRLLCSTLLCFLDASSSALLPSHPASDLSARQRKSKILGGGGDAHEDGRVVFRRGAAAAAAARKEEACPPRHAR
jgi:hypothetical protein